MTQQHSYEDDLRFVRDAVARSDTRGGLASVYLLWAALIGIGFPLVDLRPDSAGWYWMVAGPVGGGLSFVLGMRASRQQGQVDDDLTRRYVLHWLALMVAVFSLYPLAATGVLGSGAAGPMILVVLALGYVMAGIHLERPMLYVGLVLAAGFPVVLMLESWAWTLVGGLVGGALLVTAIVQRRTGGTSEG